MVMCVCVLACVLQQWVDGHHFSETLRAMIKRLVAIYDSVARVAKLCKGVIDLPRLPAD